MAAELKNWVEGLVRSPATEPIWLTYPNPPEGGDDSILQPGDYFRVRVHRIHLAYDRQWFTTFAPVLSVATQFQYGKQEITQPAIVGPSVIEQLGIPTPTNPQVVGRVVAGPHPLMSSNLTVTVALQRVKRGEIVGPFLRVIGGAANSLSLATGVEPFLALARVVVDGVSALVGEDQALMARHSHFSPVRTGHYAMVAPRDGIVRSSLYLYEDDLHQQDGEKLTQLRATHFVLYSIDRVLSKEIPLESLAFYPQWEEVKLEASNAVLDEQWLNTKTKLLELEGVMRRSPDLTERHKAELTAYWRAEAKRIRDSAVSMMADLGGRPAEVDHYARRALTVLEL